MLIYIYDPKTKEYLKSEEAAQDPLESLKAGEFIPLLAANATFDAPLESKEGFVSVWNGEAWEYVEDHRKVIYWMPEDKYNSPGHEMKELGPLPEGASLVAPEKPLEDMKADKIIEFKAIRDSLEVEPIEYAGNRFDYDDKARDRINAAIIALDLAGPEAVLSWTTADNTEAIVGANDLRGIIAAVAVRSNELHVKYRELKMLVESAVSKEELEAIIW